jgi:hypothetical protein
VRPDLCQGQALTAPAYVSELPVGGVPASTPSEEVWLPRTRSSMGKARSMAPCFDLPALSHLVTSTSWIWSSFMFVRRLPPITVLTALLFGNTPLHAHTILTLLGPKIGRLVLCYQHSLLHILGTWSPLLHCSCSLPYLVTPHPILRPQPLSSKLHSA